MKIDFDKALSQFTTMSAEITVAVVVRGDNEHSQHWLEQMEKALTQKDMPYTVLDVCSEESNFFSYSTYVRQLVRSTKLMFVDSRAGFPGGAVVGLSKASGDRAQTILCIAQEEVRPYMGELADAACFNILDVVTFLDQLDKLGYLADITTRIQKAVFELRRARMGQ